MLWAGQSVEIGRKLSRQPGSVQSPAPHGSLIKLRVSELARYGGWTGLWPVGVSVECILTPAVILHVSLSVVNQLRV